MCAIARKSAVRGASPRTAEAKEGSSLFGRTFLLIEVLLTEGRPVSALEFVERLGRPKQTVYRLLRELTAAGFLRREPVHDRYLIGPRLAASALEVCAWNYRATPRRAILRQLVQRLGESCNVGILDGDMVSYLDRVECEWPLRIQLRPGSRVPLHSTSIGKMLLANLPSRARSRVLDRIELTRFTEFTITNVDRLAAELKRIRDQGYATNNQETNVGVVSVAVPIQYRQHRVIAGLAVHAPVERMTIGQGKTYLPILREYAEKLSADIAWEAAG